MVVTHEDLVGEISNFPLHVVQMMVNNQVAQGNTANVKIFQNKKDTSKRFGGFDWSKTPQGTKYWNKAINFGCFGNDTCLPSKEVVTNESPKREKLLSSVIPAIFAVACSIGKVTKRSISSAEYEGATVIT